MLQSDRPLYRWMCHSAKVLTRVSIWLDNLIIGKVVIEWLVFVKGAHWLMLNVCMILVRYNICYGLLSKVYLSLFFLLVLIYKTFNWSQFIYCRLKLSAFTTADNVIVTPIDLIRHYSHVYLFLYVFLFCFAQTCSR